MILLIYQMDLIPFVTFKITLNLSPRNTKLLTENLPVQIYPNKIKNKCFQNKNGIQIRIIDS